MKSEKSVDELTAKEIAETVGCCNAEELADG